MAATYRASAAGGTTTADQVGTATITPAAGDLFLVFCNASGNTNAAPTCSDNNGGVYTLIDTGAWNASADMSSWFVRTTPLPNVTSTIVSVTVGNNTAIEVVVGAWAGMTRFGLSAIRSKGKEENQAATGTAAPALNQNALTTNPTACAVFSADTTTTPPASWTERQEVGQATPTTRIEMATRDSGFTSTTITFGASTSTVFASMAVELDSSAYASTDLVGAYPTSEASLAAACGFGTWTVGYLMNEASGSPAPTFGSGSLTTTASLTYAQAGMLNNAAEDAIAFAVTTGQAHGGNIHNITTGDMIGMIVFKSSGLTGVTVRDVIAKGGSPGWRVYYDGADQLALNVNGVAVSVSTFGASDWCIAFWYRDGGSYRLVFYSTQTGYRASSSGTDSNTVSNSNNFTVGSNPSNSISLAMDVDAVYFGTGASGVDAVPVTALYNFIESLRVAAATGFKNLLLLGVG